MSNGESLDGFVFPPFIPTASKPPQTPPPPAAQEPAPAPAAEAAGRMTMPWDLETPIVRESDAAQPEAPADDDEDLPWLEVPAPRGEEAAPSAPAAAGEDFPEWMAWDQRDESAAEAEARDSVAPIAGLEDFIPADDGMGGGYVAPAPALEWADADPAASAEAAPPADPFEALFDAPTDLAFEAPAVPDASAVPDAPADFAAPAFDTPAAFDGLPAFEAPADAEPFVEGSFEAPAGAEDGTWSLATPEAAEPPPFDVPAPAFEESPAAAAPSYEVSVDDGALTIEPAAAESPAAEEPVPTAQPFVADDEAVMAAEPDPFTAAAVAEAEVVAPAEQASAESPFDDVAVRLESIARMLRERPDELLAGGSSDPLALLVTGYVMGYTARGGR